MFYLAHAGEHHETAIQAAAHTVWTEWYVAIPVFLISLTILTLAAYKLTKKSFTVAFLVAMLTCLVVGVTTYQSIPALSVIALVLGFGGCLLQVLLGLGGSHIAPRK